MFPDRRRAPLLLPRRLRLDVSGGRAALPHAGGGIRERVLTPEVLLPVWLPHPRRRGGHLRRRRLQKLRHPASVSVVPRWCVFFFVVCKLGPAVFPPDGMESHLQHVSANDGSITKKSPPLAPSKFTPCQC